MGSYSGPSGGGLKFIEVQYTGDGAATKLLTIGFKALVVYITDNTANGQDDLSISDDEIIYGGNLGHQTLTTPVATATTLDVGNTTGISHSSPQNQAGHSYKLMAFG